MNSYPQLEGLGPNPQKLYWILLEAWKQNGQLPPESELVERMNFVSPAPLRVCIRKLIDRGLLKQQSPEVVTVS